MRSLELRALTILMLFVIVVATIPSGFSISMLKAQSVPNTEETVKLRLRAQLCKSMLQNLLPIVNISASERAEIEKLLSVNITTLSPEVLEKYVEKLCSYIKKLRHRIEFQKVVQVESVIGNMSRRLALRLQNEFRMLNITNDTALQLIKRLERLRNLHELHEVLIKLRHIYMSRLLHKFSNLTSDFVDQMLVRIENRGSEHALRIALMEIDKALLVLNITLQRLKSTNASEKAIEAVERVITKLSIVKNLLDEVREEIKNITVPHVELKIMLRTMLRNRIGSLANETNVTMHAMVRELQRLYEIAIRLGKHRLAEEINRSIEKLLELSALTAASTTNLSIKQALAVLVHAESVLHKAYAIAERALKEHDIAKMLSGEAEKIVEQALKLVGEIKKLKTTIVKLRIELLKERVPQLVIAVSRAWVDLSRAEMFAKRAIREVEKGDIIAAKIALIAAERLVKESGNLVENIEEALSKTVSMPSSMSMELNETVAELQKQIRAMINKLEELNTTGLPRRIRAEIANMIMELRGLLEKLSLNVTGKLVATVSQQLERLRMRIESVISKVEDVKELKKELKECEEKLARLENATKAIEKKIEKIGKVNPKVQKMLNEAKSLIKALKIEMNEVNISIEELKLELAKVEIKHLTKLVEQLEELVRALTQLAKSLPSSTTMNAKSTVPSTPSPSKGASKPCFIRRQPFV